MSIDIGMKVPDFEAQGTAGPFKLSRRTQPVLVLYFYPKDNTPGCTTESVEFGAQYKAFLKAGCEVAGVSRDSLKSHDNFRTKFELPFQLLSDADEALCQQFGVIKMKNMYGKQVRGIERSTFIIDGQGKLAQEWRGVKVKGHVGEVLEYVKTLG